MKISWGFLFLSYFHRPVIFDKIFIAGSNNEKRIDKRGVQPRIALNTEITTTHRERIKTIYGLMNTAESLPISMKKAQQRSVPRSGEGCDLGGDKTRRTVLAVILDGTIVSWRCRSASRGLLKEETNGRTALQLSGCGRIWEMAREMQRDCGIHGGI